MTQYIYPSASEQVALAAAEKLMAATMARYDPSHDAFHGTVTCDPLHPPFLLTLDLVACTLQFNV